MKLYNAQTLRHGPCTQAGCRFFRRVGITATDPLTYLLVVVLFTATACAALILPARRALRVDPLVALRAD